MILPDRRAKRRSRHDPTESRGGLVLTGNPPTSVCMRDPRFSPLFSLKYARPAAPGAASVDKRCDLFERECDTEAGKAEFSNSLKLAGFVTVADSFLRLDDPDSGDAHAFIVG